MAEDWIKMRVGLCTHPKVARIARVIGESLAIGRALRIDGNGALHGVVTRVVTRDVTIASLFRVWAAANEHTVDGVWPGIQIDDLDLIAGVPGFGKAMETVGWAVADQLGNAVILPDFLANNVPAKDGRLTNAERQSDYRARKKAAKAAARSDVNNPRSAESRSDVVAANGTASRSESNASVTEGEGERSVTTTVQHSLHENVTTVVTQRADWRLTAEEIDEPATSEGPINWPNEFADCLMIWNSLPTGVRGVIHVAGLPDPSQENALVIYRGLAWLNLPKRDKEAFMSFWPGRKAVAIQAMQAIARKAIEWDRDAIRLRDFQDEIDKIIGDGHRRRPEPKVAARTKRTRVDDIQDMLSDFGNHIDASLAVPSTKIETTATRKLT